MNKLRHTLLLFSLLPCLLQAQQPAGSSQSLEQYRAQQRQQRQAYADSLNNQFHQYLKRQWESFELYKAENRPLRPEPDTMPVIDSPSDTLDQPLPAGDIVLLPPQSPADPVGAFGRFASQPFQVAFYGTTQQFDIPKGLPQLELRGIREAQVSRFWEQLDKQRLENLAGQLADKRRVMHLNDWGLFDLTRALAAGVYPASSSQQTALTVYLLNTMHYDLRMGRVGDQLYPMIATNSRIYELPFAIVGNNRYYLVPPAGSDNPRGNLFTYRAQLPSAARRLSMQLCETPQLGGRVADQPYRSTFFSRSICYYPNQSLMDFYAAYPQTDLSIYANAAVADDLCLALSRAIRPQLADRGHLESVNLLLRYLQEGFAYRTDAAQYGHEKNNFCEENFYYPANDCEDRAILFCHLVRTLIGLDVVLLEYPDHVAAAVSFPNSDVRGCYYFFQEHKYTVCDPTCHGAKAGQLAARHKRQTPRIIQTI